MTVRMTVAEVLDLCIRAARGAGARAETAEALAKSAVSAEASGMPPVGLAHFLDHLKALEAGRIDGRALPEIMRPLPCLFHVDGHGGAAQTGFDAVFDALVETATAYGLALFAQKNTYTSGELGYFAERLASEGLVAMAATNGPALLAGSGSTRPVYCTNPLAFAAPRDDGPPLLIDQASSQTAFGNVRLAARQGRLIPQGWAIDADGNPTTDPIRAMKGAMLAYGGQRGANVALMVEVLAAGLSGANWSLDAPSFTSGGESPGAGLTVLAIAPAALDPDFPSRLGRQLRRLAGEYGVHVPGGRKEAASKRAATDGINVGASVLAAIAAFAGRSGLEPGLAAKITQERDKKS